MARVSAVKKSKKRPAKKSTSKSRRRVGKARVRVESQKVEELFTTVTASDSNVTELLEVLTIPEPALGEAADALANGLKTRPAIREAFQRLETDLPAWLRYHAPAHTDRVFRYAILLALADKMANKDLELLGLAAAYHDLGYANGDRRIHEELGARLAAESMKRGGYSEEDIERVRIAITDTKLWPSRNKVTFEQVPESDLGEYLADADLSNFGMSDFLEQSKLVFQEQQFERKGADVLIQDASRDELLNYLVAVERFFSNHKWHTKAGKRIFGPTKESNAKRLKEAIATLKKLRTDTIPKQFFARFE